MFKLVKYFMPTRLMIIGLLVCSGIISAQETRTDAPNANHSGDDEKLDRDQVPAAYAVDVRFERIVLVRCKFDTDLLVGIQAMVKKQHIRNAVILAGIGSVRGYKVHTVTNRCLPAKTTFITDPTASGNLDSVSGYVINGKVHAHVILSTPAKSFGGHLELGTTVFTFALVTLGVLGDEVDLSRMDDSSYR